MIDFTTGAPITGNLDVRWIHGSLSAKANTDPPIQVHRYDDHTFILRQNKAVHYEAPFMFLLCGNERALLLDTGATADPTTFPLRATVDGLLRDWLERNPRDHHELVVAHTHGHGDHVQGDDQFAGRPDTALLPKDVAAVCAYFGFTNWPTQVVHFDLGGRILDIVGIPGHQSASIAVYDPWTGLLFTGDSVLPGRLYAPDFATYTDSLNRLVDFAAAREVKWLLGCHVEMTTTPRRDYPVGTTYQPAERPLQLAPAKLAEIRDAVVALANRPGATVFDDYAVYHGPCRGAIRRQLARAAVGRTVNRIRAAFTPAG